MQIEDVALCERAGGSVLMVKVRGRWVEGTTGTGLHGDWIFLNQDIVFTRRFPDA